MEYMATITSKGQFTIPAKIYKKARLKPGTKVVVKLINEDQGLIYISPIRNLVDELAGSVKLSSAYKGLNLSEITRKAREEYYKSQK